MRQFVLVVAAALLAGCGLSQASSTSPGEGGAQASRGAANWHGTWRLVSYTSDGETAQADIEWVIDEDRYVIRGGDITGQESYPYTLDPSNSRIDVHHHDTPQGTHGGHFKGIYEIDGDRMKVCYDLTGRQYPRSFEAGPGSRQVLYQFQRQ